MTGSDTAARLRGAARAILVAEGAAAVSIRRVATAVGVTPMATYRHYANREALLNAVADEEFTALAKRWEAPEQLGDPLTRLYELLDAYLDFALGTPHLYSFLIVDRREGALRYPEDFRAGRSDAFARLMQVVGHGMLTKAFRTDDLVEVALTLTAQLQGLIQLYLSDRVALPEKDFRDLCRRCVERILNGLAS
jgi:AcrR family transcriptional regulator